MYFFKVIESWPRNLWSKLHICRHIFTNTSNWNQNCGRLLDDLRRTSQPVSDPGILLESGFHLLRIIYSVGESKKISFFTLSALLFSSRVYSTLSSRFGHFWLWIQRSGFKNTHLRVSHTTNSKLRFTFWFHALWFALAWVCNHATAQKQLHLAYLHPAIITCMGWVSFWTVMTTAFYYDFIKQRAYPSCCLPVGVTLSHFV